MKKVRNIPSDIHMSDIQTAEHQAYLRKVVAEKGQKTIALGFTDGKLDNLLTLGEVEFQVLKECQKEPSDNWGTKHTIWEEGEAVCYAYGILTLRGLVCWTLHTVAEGTWLLPGLTEAGKQFIDSPENDPYQYADEFVQN